MRESDGVILRHASWDFYERFLTEISDRQRIYLTYNEGALEIRHPSPRHEAARALIRSLINILTLELRVPMMSLGSSTLRRPDLSMGVDPDESFYVQNERRMRQKAELSLFLDPPPDLVLDVNVVHRCIAREAIYQAMGIPELWTFDEDLTAAVLHLDESGRYQMSTHSAAIPGFEVRILDGFLRRWPDTDQTTIRLAFQDWVRGTFE